MKANHTVFAMLVVGYVAAATKFLRSLSRGLFGRNRRLAFYLDEIGYKRMSRRNYRRGPLFDNAVVVSAVPILDLDDSSLGACKPRGGRVPRWKRLLDVVGVLLCAACLWPLVIMIALLIKISSRGPILFRQERVGLFGKPFVIYKFRTMVVGADTCVHEAHAADLIESGKPMTKLDSRGDTRLIRFGRLLRAAGLDELPQLINVWLGEMSLVGPRPCLPGEAERYQIWQQERFLTPPGLTGLWQVSGKNKTTFNEMVQLDIEYVRKRSLLLDLKIIFRTIPAVMGEVRDIRASPQPASCETSESQKEQ
ncbi:MAG: sugar transferase [Methylocystis sp.]|uniref:sugar transferase n=1 Tax=Methylocystis sp. TaxID=1911079 RepID=UPI0039289013